MATQTKPKTEASKSAKSPATPFAAFETAMPNFEMPTFDMPAAFREFTEKGMSQARDSYAKMKTAAEDATDLVEDTFQTARDGATALGVKAVDAAKASSDASFALVRDMFGAKTVAEMIELQTAFARQQFEVATAQFKEFQELAQKVASETAKPVSDKVEKTFKDFQTT